MNNDSTINSNHNEKMADIKKNESNLHDHKCTSNNAKRPYVPPKITTFHATSGLPEDVFNEWSGASFITCDQTK